MALLIQQIQLAISPHHIADMGSSERLSIRITKSQWYHRPAITL